MTDEFKIQSTIRYSQFRRIRGNRKINKAHLAKLVMAIEEKNLLSSNPIQVNERMEVIDGQHRLEAAEKLKTPVYFIVIPAGGLAEIQMLNNNAGRWVITDFLESWIERGKEDYNYLKDFSERYGITVSNSMHLLQGTLGTRGKEGTLDEFRRGNFVASQKEMAIDFVKKLRELESFLEDGVVSDRNFLVALSKVYQKVDHQKLIDKIKQPKKRMVLERSTKNYLRDFEDILSWRSQRVTRLA